MQYGVHLRPDGNALISAQHESEVFPISRWKSEAERLKFDDGLTWKELTDAMVPFFPNYTKDRILEIVRRYLRGTKRYQQSHVSVQRTEAKEPKPAKVEVIQNLEPSTIEVNWKGNRVVRFAIMGDTQINSKYTQITHLHAFYDECARQGIRHVYHTGDIDEGERMRPGHQYECYRQGADEHVDEICRVYPTRNGMTTHFITGNHDASMIKNCGHNIGFAIESKRDDMKYLGSDCAIVKLTPNCILELRHPWDGSAYALSYKTQKMMDAMAGGEKPNILAVGHYHKAEYLFYRNIHAFQSGCFQAQTPFMRGKSLSAHMGGWIIEIDVNSDGFIECMKQQFIPYYTAIQDDYRNWR